MDAFEHPAFIAAIWIEGVEGKGESLKSFALENFSQDDSPDDEIYDGVSAEKAPEVNARLDAHREEK